MKAKIASWAIVGFLTMIASASAVVAQDGIPSQLVKLTKAGSYDATTGDLVVITFASNPSTGPANPAANLKVEVKGSGLAKKVIVVFAPPARPVPGASGEIHAYLATEGAGDATVTVTPINGIGKAGTPVTYKVKVSAQ